MFDEQKENSVSSPGSPLALL